ncbi:TRAP transporter small permease subunit [uncultured Paracoccus sp.]|uniref:TRAP transporter small permease subunit n=1 Tax=uncultured Paracoccus sp. TaxID=189685 RepID=UPI002638D0D1|nr:TRAP transporter small permease subunit [uncultured Paracoccus sp.]
MLRYIDFADRLSGWFGKSFGWLVLLMTLGMSYEVIVRYLFNSPTPWAYELSFIMYGSLFMVGGAYTLSRGGHVRGDFIYRMWPVRVQGTIDLVLYVIFFFPGITALIFAGWKYAARSVGYGEVSASSPAGIPIYQFKSILVLAGILLFIQGIAQVFRSIIAIRTGVWHEATPDVEETEILLAQERGEELVHHPDHTHPPSGGTVR